MRAHVATQPRVPMPVVARKPIKVVCGCKDCTYVASAVDEGRALRGWAAHRVLKHREGGHREARDH